MSDAALSEVLDSAAGYVSDTELATGTHTPTPTGAEGSVEKKANPTGTSTPSPSTPTPAPTAVATPAVTAPGLLRLSAMSKETAERIMNLAILGFLSDVSGFHPDDQPMLRSIHSGAIPCASSAAAVAPPLLSAAGPPPALRLPAGTAAHAGAPPSALSAAFAAVHPHSVSETKYVGQFPVPGNPGITRKLCTDVVGGGFFEASQLAPLSASAASIRSAASAAVAASRVLVDDGGNVSAARADRKRSIESAAQLAAALSRAKLIATLHATALAAASSGPAFGARPFPSPSEVAAQMDAYIAMIIQCSSDLGDAAAILYDQDHRLHRVLWHEPNWWIRDEARWGMRVREESESLRALKKAKTVHHEPRPRNPPPASHRQVCNNYNFRSCPGSCGRTHICSKCGASGHPALKCDSKPSAGK